MGEINGPFVGSGYHVSYWALKRPSREIMPSSQKKWTWYGLMSPEVVKPVRVASPSPEAMTCKRASGPYLDTTCVRLRIAPCEGA